MAADPKAVAVFGAINKGIASGATLAPELQKIVADALKGYEDYANSANILFAIPALIGDIEQIIADASAIPAEVIAAFQ